MNDNSPKYHILTPFSRKENVDAILKNFHRPNIVFHPIMDKPIRFPKESWIEPFSYKPDPGVQRPPYHAWNKFFNSGKLIDDDYYLFICDDDFLEPDFFEKIKDVKTDIILVSMKRGDNPTSKGSPNSLIPNGHNLVRSRVAAEQLIAKGKILKNVRFKDHMTADGIVIGNLWRHLPHNLFTFSQDTFVWFNYLEPGRWNINTDNT